MKKALALILAVACIFILFAACGQKNNPTPTQAPTATTAPTATDAPEATPEPTAEPDSPYNLAAGNFEKNAEGFPTEPYEYELPLSTTDEVFTYWTVVWTPQYVPEDGYGSMPFPQGMEELTGVNIEYVVVSSDTRKENFSVLLNSDSLCDAMTGAVSFYPGSPVKAIEEGYFINVHDYMDYCPNYIYQATFNANDLRTKETIFYTSDTILTFYAMMKQAVIGSNYMARGDWLEKLGMTNDDIVTWDDLYDMLGQFKSQIDGCEYPWPMFSSIDMAGLQAFTSYDTLPYINPYGLPSTYVIDGTVYFANMTERDKAQMQEFNRFYAAGYIDPNWTGYANNTSFTSKTTGGEVGYVYMSPGEVKDYETNSVDPNATWVAIHKPSITEGQTFHVGGELARSFYGSASISAKCSNIELLCSWIDYRYSPSGSFYASYGPEGVMWEYDQDGNVMATEWALNNPDGLGYAWMCMLYGLNSLAEPGMEDGDRKYAYPGGERMKAISYYWADYDYDGAYEMPAGVRLTTEENDEVTTYKSDIMTYIAENYPGFIDGSKSFDEWDAYVQGIFDLGMQNVIDLYQGAYDRYLATK